MTTPIKNIRAERIQGTLDGNGFNMTGSLIITGSLTVITGSNVEFQVLNTGVRLGNVIGDAHTVTGSLGVSGSTSFNGNVTATIGGNTEFQVLNTGVRLGNVIGDAHTVTGSLGVSGSNTIFNSNFQVEKVSTLNGEVQINNQTGGIPGAFNISAGTVNNYWGVADGDFLSTPTIWLKLTLDSSFYYIPSYQ